MRLVDQNIALRGVVWSDAGPIDQKMQVKGQVKVYIIMQVRLTLRGGGICLFAEFQIVNELLNSLNLLDYIYLGLTNVCLLKPFCHL